MSNKRTVSAIILSLPAEASGKNGWVDRQFFRGFPDVFGGGEVFQLLPVIGRDELVQGERISPLFHLFLGCRINIGIDKADRFGVWRTGIP